MTSSPLGTALDENALLPGARSIPSPNNDERPQDAVVSLIVIHSISLPPGEFGGDAIERLFTNRLDPAEHPYYRTIHAETLRVSAHFLIRRDGSVIQFVPCNRRAWHAGQSNGRGRARCNDFSAGIALEGGDDLPLEDAQYQALAHVIGVLRRSYPNAAIAGHADIAPHRKTDPGPCFDWSRVPE